MGRPLRQGVWGIVYGVLKRRVLRLPLFEDEGDGLAFERVLGEVVERSAGAMASHGQHPVAAVGTRSAAKIGQSRRGLSEQAGGSLRLRIVRPRPRTTEKCPVTYPTPC